MLQGKCLLCFTLNRKTFNILNTHLQQVLEKIVNAQIEADSLCLCFICHKRMQQCYQLIQQAKKSLSYLNTMLTEKVEPLLELTTSKIVNTSSLPFGPYIETDVVVKKEYLNVCKDEMEQQKNYDESSKCIQGVTDQLKDISSEHDDQQNATTLIKTEVDEEVASHYEEMEQQENLDESLECTQGVTDKPITDVSSEHDDQKHAPNWIKTDIEEIPIHYEASESKKLINEEKAKNSAKMNDDELILRRKKQNADRARAYRKRQKDIDAMPSTSTVQSGEPVSGNIVTSKLLHQKQLNAERCRRYRQKCKRLKSGASFNPDTSDSNTSTSQDTSPSRELIVNPEELSHYLSHFPSIKLRLMKMNP